MNYDMCKTSIQPNTKHANKQTSKEDQEPSHKSKENPQEYTLNPNPMPTSHLTNLDHTPSSQPQHPIRTSHPH